MVNMFITFSTRQAHSKVHMGKNKCTTLVREYFLKKMKVFYPSGY